MCGRFTREYNWQNLHDQLHLCRAQPGQTLAPSFNVAPGHHSAIVRAGIGADHQVAVALWGLIRPRAGSVSAGAQLINAHAEGMGNDPDFRAAYRRRRCVVPVSAFFEWQDDAGREMKQPWYIHPKDGGIMYFAGLWERWEKTGTPTDSFTIITTGANAFMRRLHNRMPAILRPEALDAWLDPTAPPERLNAMLQPAPDGLLDAHPVGTRVNDVNHDDPSLVVPV